MIEVEENGYRVRVSAEGVKIAAIGRGYDQRDERAYECCLFVPMSDLGALGDLVSRVHKVGSDAGFWEPA